MIHKFTPVLRREPTDGQPEHSTNLNWPSQPASARADKIKVADLQ